MFLLNDLHDMSLRARNAYYDLSVSDLQSRNRVLLTLSEILKEKAEEIFAQNQLDLADAEKSGLPAPLLHRLKFGRDKLAQVTAGLDALSTLPICSSEIRRLMASNLTERMFFSFPAYAFLAINMSPWFTSLLYLFGGV